MHYHWKIECWDADNVYTHTWMAYLLFHDFHLHQCHLVVQGVFQAEVGFWSDVALQAQVAFWAEVEFRADVAIHREVAFQAKMAFRAEVAFRAEIAFRMEAAFRVDMPRVLVEVCRFLSASGVSADCFLCDLSLEGRRPYDFYKPLLGVFLLQPSPFYAQDTQLLASSVLRLRHEGS